MSSALAEDVSGCYMQVIQRDTFIANLRQQGQAITGKLISDNFEKDGSAGTVSGQIENNILKLVYSFQSEGMNSIMDVYFKKEGDALIRGTGDMQTKGDTAFFTSPGSVNYSQNDKLIKLACEQIPSRYR